jgi:hypothetical protein
MHKIVRCPANIFVLKFSSSCNIMAGMYKFKESEMDCAEIWHIYAKWMLFVWNALIQKTGERNGKIPGK